MFNQFEVLASPFKARNSSSGELAAECMVRRAFGF
jgi:hypothetical protein